MPRHRLAPLSELSCTKASLFGHLSFAFQLKCPFLRKWLGGEPLLTVEITQVCTSFTFLFACLIPSYIYRHTPAASGWSETRCDQPNVILMYQQTLCLSVFNLHNPSALLTQRWASFLLLLGHVVIKGSVLGRLRRIHGENQTVMIKLRAQVQAQSQPLIKAITS